MQTAGIKLYDNRALISKRNSAIAFALLDIFTTYGAPAILQSDNYAYIIMPTARSYLVL